MAQSKAGEKDQPGAAPFVSVDAIIFSSQGLSPGEAGDQPRLELNLDRIFFPAMYISRTMLNS